MELLNVQLLTLQPHKTYQLPKHLNLNTPISHNSHPPNPTTLPPNFSPTTTKRRTLNNSLLTIIVSVSLPFHPPHCIADEGGSHKVDDELERYTDTEQGFTLLRPVSYTKVEKAGATVLFEEVGKGANNVGVVVNPVKISSLTDFGTPQFVADKLILAEKRKESTKEAEVIGVTERLGLDGLPIYEFEYVVDSTRGGMKRIFSAVFISEKKLHLLNITHVDKPESPLDSHTRTTLEQVLHSFDVAPLKQNI